VFHSAVVAPAAILSNVSSVQHFAGALIMEIASHTSTRSHLAGRSLFATTPMALILISDSLIWAR
jgi:hypothetical protein